MNRMEVILAELFLADLVGKIIDKHEGIWSNEDYHVLVLELGRSFVTYEKLDALFTAIAESEYAHVPFGLTLSYNNIGRIPESVYKFKGLTVLDLTDTGLTELPGDIFDHLRNLAELSLGQNRLTRLPDGLSSLSELWWLDLADNELTAAPFSLVGELPPKLSYLNLTGNKIRNMPKILTSHRHFGPECAQEEQRLSPSSPKPTRYYTGRSAQEEQRPASE